MIEDHASVYVCMGGTGDEIESKYLRTSIRFAGAAFPGTNGIAVWIQLENFHNNPFRIGLISKYTSCRVTGKIGFANLRGKHVFELMLLDKLIKEKCRRHFVLVFLF